MEESTEKFYKFYDRDDEEIFIRPSSVNVVEVRKNNKVFIYTDCHVVEVPYDKNTEEGEKLLTNIGK